VTNTRILCLGSIV